MARRQIPVYKLNRIAYNPNDPVQDTGTGLFFSDNLGQTFLEVQNDSAVGGTIAAVIADNEVDFINVPNKEMFVAPGSAVKFGPFPTRFYSQENLDVYIDSKDMLSPNAGTLLIQAFQSKSSESGTVF